MTDHMPQPTSGFAAAIDAIYRAAAAPELWPDTLTLLADHVGAIGGMLVYHAPAGQRSFMVSARLREDLRTTYLQHYTRNPYTLALAKMAPGRVQIANRLVDAAVIRRSAFHADILAPQAIADQL